MEMISILVGVQVYDLDSCLLSFAYWGEHFQLSRAFNLGLFARFYDHIFVENLLNLLPPRRMHFSPADPRQTEKMFDKFDVCRLEGWP